MGIKEKIQERGFTLDKLREIASIIGISVSELLRENGEHSATCPNCGQEFEVILKPKAKRKE